MRSLATSLFFFLSLFHLIVDVGILCQIHKLEVQGRKVKMSIWVRRSAFFLSSERTDAEMLFFGTIYCICRTLQVKTVSEPSPHRITAEHRASYSVRICAALRSSPSWLTRVSLSSLAVHAHVLSHVFNMHLVCDVLNRESFEALPRWLEELENYVPLEVVKIVIGNKLDKVK